MKGQKVYGMGMSTGVSLRGQLKNLLLEYHLSLWLTLSNKYKYLSGCSCISGSRDG